MTKRLLAACLCLAFASPAALADASASASISDIRYQLIDLDPNDGILPEITFAGGSESASISLYAWEGNSNLGGYKTLDSAGSIDITRSFANVAASTAQNALSSAIFLQVPGGPASSANASSYAIRNFTLSPNTGLIWSAIGNLAAVAPGVGASVRVFGTLSDTEGSQIESRRFSLDYNTWGGGDSVNLSGYLFTDDQALSGNLSVSTSVFGVANSVPEPSTWGMLFAGLAVVGARRRRRSKAAR
jgi:hypothetical protein